MHRTPKRAATPNELDHLRHSLLYVLQLVFAYQLMLAIMTFNVGISIAVFSGTHLATTCSLDRAISSLTRVQVRSWATFSFIATARTLRSKALAATSASLGDCLLLYLPRLASFHMYVPIIRRHHNGAFFDDGSLVHSCQQATDNNTKCVVVGRNETNKRTNEERANETGTSYH